VTDAVRVRPAGRADLPLVLQLARRALGWRDPDERFLVWKHFENPLGPSPMWVAESDGRVVGFRALVRWDLVLPSGTVVHAVRAVDTATDPDFQGRGIFTRLTATALDELPAAGITMVFNTPNDKSRPGYEKLGWRTLGRLPVAALPSSLRFPVVVATAATAAARDPLPRTAGVPAAEALADPDAVARLLASLPPAGGVATRRTPAWLAWRYGNPELGYRAVLAGRTAEDGLAVFRVRARGRAAEAALCEVLVPGAERAAGRALTRRVARLAHADYLVRIDPHPVTRDPFVRLPRVGPVLACRPLDGSAAPDLGSWALTMGDVELF